MLFQQARLMSLSLVALSLAWGTPGIAGGSDSESGPEVTVARRLSAGAEVAAAAIVTADGSGPASEVVVTGAGAAAIAIADGSGPAAEVVVTGDGAAAAACAPVVEDGGGAAAEAGGVHPTLGARYAPLFAELVESLVQKLNQKTAEARTQCPRGRFNADHLTTLWSSVLDGSDNDAAEDVLRQDAERQSGRREPLLFPREKRAAEEALKATTQWQALMELRTNLTKLPPNGAGQWDQDLLAMLCRVTFAEVLSWSAPSGPLESFRHGALIHPWNAFQTITVALEDFARDELLFTDDRSSTLPNTMHAFQEKLLKVGAELDPGIAAKLARN